ncbi:MAG: tetratricopeptide repeat protein [Alphaproteobacteria bacterium]|nr:tetratricopeptide repeat protein [Alphaproteobacteria bacterium]
MSAAEHLEQAQTHLTAGRLNEAIAAARQALSEDPENMEALLLSARIVRRSGNVEAAAELYAAILEHHPDSAEAEAGMGACCGLLGLYSDAEASLRRAIALKPDYFEAWSFLAEALVEQGKTTEAMGCFERSLSIQPYNPTALSKYLFHTVFDPRYDAARIASLNRDWGGKIAATVEPLDLHVGGDGPLRIGYLSDEFYERVTARFMAPVLAHHDRTRFHVTGYARNTYRDSTTETLEALTDRWRDLSGLDDRAAAEAIRADEIDILVLCTSYRAETRTVLAFKPAPIQVCYSNLVSTTGLPTVDYLITEEATDPAGSDALYTEKLVRLSNRNIYQPPEASPEPSPPPCLANGYVTFASFNNLGKVTPAVVVLWSRILQALPESKLAMKSVNRLADAGARQYFLNQFAAHGIEPERIDLLTGDSDLQAHLSRYRSVDIALDPFPCNGGTTSCEALWMGVPVVTMAGETFMGRQGSNYLGKLGLHDLIASTKDDYVAAAVRLASNTTRLQTLRDTLRQEVKARLFDPASHVAELETTYMEMARRQRDGERPGPFRVQGDRVLA